MILFATEFPVKPIPDRAAFVAQVVSWLRGTNYSTVLESHAPDLDSDAAHLRSQTDEQLQLREFAPRGALEAIGFRHDFPDDKGRLWRTEVVLRRKAVDGGQDIIRLRTQCIARKPSAQLEFPRKPYLIKSILDDGWGGRDGDLDVSDKPTWLVGNDSSLEVARKITFGQASRYLPIVYVSAVGEADWAVGNHKIEKLAFDLGGIAHVVVEPDRAFSFRLRDITAGANAYGGALAIVLPARGIVRRLFLGLRTLSADDLVALVREFSARIRSQMPSEGWDWTELQEQALRWQRERDRNRLTQDETERLYQEEIANFRDPIKQLESQLESRHLEENAKLDEEVFPAFLFAKVGPEIYSGEFFDRLRFAAKECLNRSEQIGLDARSRFIYSSIVDNFPLSPALYELVEDLKRATKNPKRLAAEVTSLLSRHGYREKADNKHIRLEANNGYGGLEAITLPKTPSENRGLVNLRKQVERTLGIAKILE